jgi:ABC-type transport system involved in Fe-S cluster assembly fused permease/ATPase subunit
MVLLEYLHAPAVGFYFLGACAFSFCILEQPKPLPHTRRRGVLALTAVTLVAYVAEVLYYFSRSMTHSDYEPPKPAAICCLGSILVWSPLLHHVWASKLIRWHPYLGACVLHFIFEAATCLITAFGAPRRAKQQVVFGIGCTRAFVSSLLVVDAFVIHFTRHVEEKSDEARHLLSGNKIASDAATAFVTRERSAILDDGEEHADSDNEVKDQQAKRLEEEGGWLGYLKAFTVFVPYLFPKDDWMVMGALVLRLVYMLQERALNLLTPRQLGRITNRLLASDPSMPWRDIGLWILFSYIGSDAGLGILDDLADLVISNSAYRRIALLAYNHVLRLSMDFHTSKDSGEVLKAVEQASSLHSLVETVLFDLCPIVLDLVVAMYFIASLFDAYMAFIVLFMAALYTSIGWYSTSLSQPKRREYVEKQRTESSTVNEVVHNWQTVAYFNRPSFEYERYALKIRQTNRAQYSYYTSSIGGHAAQSIVTSFGFAGCCVFGMTQIVAGRKRVGDLVTLLTYWPTLTSPLHVLSRSHRHISSSLIDAERLLQLLKTRPTVADKEGARPLEVKEGRVRFKDVEFAYDARKPIIKVVNFEAGGGQTIAFVGETGGGKSTLLKLLFRFYDVTAGAVMIDGQDVRSVTQSSLRDALGLVPQDPVLFNQTIRQNIRYARLEATDEEIEDACCAAIIHKDIVDFPDGYNSKVGERGVRLSGGQLQRIAIARVLLQNPKIVLLDEATSAIDSSVEALIQEAFRKLSQGRTTFVIAHRLSTIVAADQILVVEHGEVVERGRHHELLDVGGKYFELWTKQTAGYHAADTSISADDKANSSTPLIDIPPGEEEFVKGTGARGRK